MAGRLSLKKKINKKYRGQVCAERWPFEILCTRSVQVFERTWNLHVLLVTTHQLHRSHYHNALTHLQYIDIFTEMAVSLRFIGIDCFCFNEQNCIVNVSIQKFIMISN